MTGSAFPDAEPGAPELHWPVKRSLVDYVRAQPDGRVEAGDGAREVDGAFVFAAAGSGRFRGRVVLTAHHGMLRVVLADPSLEPAEAPTQLWIDDGQGRLPFAALAPDGSATLTADGADLFMAGPYDEGTALDPPVVR